MSYKPDGYTESDQRADRDFLMGAAFGRETERARIAAALLAIHEPFECCNVRCKPGRDGIAAGDDPVHWPCPTLRALGVTYD